MATILRALSGASNAGKGTNDDVLSMIPIPFKETKAYDYGIALGRYIEKHYEDSSSRFSKEIADVNKLRSGVTLLARNEDGRNLYRKYYSQLKFMEHRFPLLFESSREGEGPGIEWENTFDGTYVSSKSLRLEVCGVLYNLGALQADVGKLALGGELVNFKDEQLKTGMFAALSVLVEDAPGEEVPPDSTVNCCKLLESLMLAQAQECILHKVLLGAKRSGLVPRVAMQVADLYDAVHTALLVINPASVKEHPWKLWVPRTRVKSQYFRAYAQFLQSKICLEKQTYGEEVARLRVANSLLDDITKQLKKQERGLASSTGFVHLQGLIAERKVKAEDDNTAVYHERVVAEELLEEIQAQLLVKALAVTVDPAAADIFEKLIPMEIHLAASAYSDQADTLVRTLDAEVCEKNAAVTKALASMGLANGDHKNTDVALPADLFQKAALLRDNVTGMQDYETRLKACEATQAEMFELYKKVDVRFLEHGGDLRPTLHTKFRAELDGLLESLEQAKKVDKDARALWTSLTPHLTLLAGPVDALRSAMPKTNVLDSPVAPLGTTTTLDAKLQRITELRLQRMDSVSQLRMDISNADLTEKLVAAENTDVVIADAMAEHQQVVDDVHANLSEQDTLLREVIDINAALKQSRAFANEQREAQQEFVSSLEEAYNQFNDLRRRVGFGLDFYKSFRDSIANMERKLNGAIKDVKDKEAMATTAAVAAALAQSTSMATASPARDNSGSSVGSASNTINPFAQLQSGSAVTIHPPAGSPSPPILPANAFPTAPNVNPFAMAAASIPSRSGSESSSNTTDDSVAVYRSRMPDISMLPDMTLRRDDYGSNPSLQGALTSGSSSGGGVGGGRGTATVGKPSAADTIAALEEALAAFERRVGELERVGNYGATGYERAYSVLQVMSDDGFDMSQCADGLANSTKNRYRDVLPMDCARVHLQVVEPGANDYINASYLKALLPGSPDYITAQGPTPETCGDFWKMLVQQRVRVVVMVTNLCELGKVKCDQYWPKRVGETREFPYTPQGHSLDVTCTGERVFEAWVERQLSVVEYDRDNQRISHTVYQYHFTAWPDRDVPDSPSQFLEFLHAVMAVQRRESIKAKTTGDPKCPLLVHCSAGVGRTGTFCAIYSVLNSLPYMGRSKAVASINIQELIMQMRRSRRHMIQTPSQYVFTHRTVLHAAREYLSNLRGQNAGAVNTPSSLQQPTQHCVPPSQPYQQAPAQTMRRPLPPQQTQQFHPQPHTQPQHAAMQRPSPQQPQEYQPQPHIQPYHPAQTLQRLPQQQTLGHQQFPPHHASTGPAIPPSHASANPFSAPSARPPTTSAGAPAVSHVAEIATQLPAHYHAQQHPQPQPQAAPGSYQSLPHNHAPPPHGAVPQQHGPQQHPSHLAPAVHHAHPLAGGGGHDPRSAPIATQLDSLRVSSHTHPAPLPHGSPALPRVIRVSNRRGNANFVNGVYLLMQPGNHIMPVYKHIATVPPGFGPASGQNVFVHYNKDNGAWVMTLVVGSKSVIAYCQCGPHVDTMFAATGKWMVTESHGYQVDRDLRVAPETDSYGGGAGGRPTSQPTGAPPPQGFSTAMVHHHAPMGPAGAPQHSHGGNGPYYARPSTQAPSLLD